MAKQPHDAPPPCQCSHHNGWGQYSELVLNTIRRNEAGIEKLAEGQQTILIELAGLKVGMRRKMSFMVAMGAAIPIVILLAVEVLKR